MIWLFLPAYNEADALPRLLPRLEAVLRDAGEDHRLLVVDDGSTDDTARILADFATRMPLDVLTHPRNRGLGETERDGFEYIAARCAPDDIIVRVEGDNTHDPGYVMPLVAKVREGCDVVTTSRFSAGGGQEGVSGYRALLSSGATWFMRVLFRIPGVREYTCGFRAYRARALQDALAVFGDGLLSLRSYGFCGTLEILVKLNLLGCRCAEIPFVLRYDRKSGQSKMPARATIMGYLAMAMRYHCPFRGWRRRYRGLAEQYRRDRAAAVAAYARPPGGNK